MGEVSAQVATQTLDVGTDRQLFVGPWADDGRDDHLVEAMQHVTMTMNEAQATGERLMELDRPWERGQTDRLDVYHCVLRDGDLLRMYYGALPKYPELWGEPCCRIMCYAQSADGLHWEKPDLGLCEWEGSRSNNIILPNDEFPYLCSELAGPAAFCDPGAHSPDGKYKMFAKLTPVAGHEQAPDSLPKGQYPFRSPDGIHWRLMNRRKVNPSASDTHFSVFWDERIGRYVQYTRVKPADEAQTRYFQERFGVSDQVPTRMVGRAESDDFLNWGEETIVIAPDDDDRAGAPGPISRVDFYGGNVSPYTEAPSIYLALLNVHSHWNYVSSDHGPEGFPGTVDVQLATSRDGIQWNRAPGRRPFLRLRPEGTFWSKMVYPSSDIIRMGDELWIYFGGLDAPHVWNAESNGARGRAVLRLDGFISADAAYTGGQLTTRPLITSGATLQLNCATGAGGTVQVEVQDEAGRPLHGLSLADADEINGNHLRVAASWQGSTDVSAVGGRPFRLRFLMRDAKLYSFQFLA